MYLEIALILAAFLQLAAALIAISLIKRTKFNISWMLISFGFFLMASRRVYELITTVYEEGTVKGHLLSSWIAVLTSLLLFIGTIYIRQIFNLQKRIEQLRKENESRVLAAIIRTEEESRQRFAKELHDGLGPLLSTVKMSLSAINKTSLGDKNKLIIDNTDIAIDKSITAVKEISNNLSPHILKNYGLDRAVRDFTRHINHSDKIEIIVSSNIKDKRFEYNVEVVSYRVICELVSNSLKHARASKISVDLFHLDNMLEIVYCDNGIGMDIEEVIENPVGMGIPNIYSRIKSLNGTIDFLSLPDEGVSIKININA